MDKVTTTIIAPMFNQTLRVSDMEKNIEMGIIVAAGVITLITNGFFFSMSCCRPSLLKKSFYLLLLSRGFINMTLGVVEIPFACSGIAYGQQDFSQGLCNFAAVSFGLPLTVNMWTGALIALNRYLRVVSINTYNTVFGPCKTFVYMLAIWFLCSLQFFQLFKGTQNAVFSPKQLSCVTFGDVSMKSPQWRHLLEIILCYLAPLILTSLLMLRLHCIIDEEEKGQGHWKITKVVSKTVVVDLATILPYAVLMALTVYGSVFNQFILRYTRHLSVLRMAINPIIVLSGMPPFNSRCRSETHRSHNYLELLSEDPFRLSRMTPNNTEIEFQVFSSLPSNAYSRDTSSVVLGLRPMRRLHSRDGQTVKVKAHRPLNRRTSRNSSSEGPVMSRKRSQALLQMSNPIEI